MPNLLVGAHGLALRNRSLESLVSALQLRLKAKEKINVEQRRRIEELEARVEKDPLTGLINRAGFEERLKREFRKGKRESNALSLILFDLDFFKKVNDTYGHSGGDAVLKAVSRLLENCARPGDYVVRWGGEELAILCPATTEEQAMSLAERCRLAVSALEVPFDDRIIKVSVSVGIGGMRLREMESDFSKFFDRVDHALYEAKAGGRNRVVLSRIPNQKTKVA